MAEHPPNNFADDLGFHVRCNGFCKGHIVTIQILTQVFECSCRKFVTHDICCNHVINIMLLLNVKRLLDRYILKCWTKYVKIKTDEPLLCSKPNNAIGVLRRMIFVNHLMRIAYDLGFICKEEAHTSNVQEGLTQMKSQICPVNLETTRSL